MKLLIVDDEKLTREGILKSLPLEKLGIHHTFMADDGVHGLEIALKEKPDLKVLMIDNGRSIESRQCPKR